MVVKLSLSPSEESLSLGPIVTSNLVGFLGNVLWCYIKMYNVTTNASTSQADFIYRAHCSFSHAVRLPKFSHKLED